MKTSRKLIPALSLLLVSAIVLSTASYAWFSMSKEVQATSMDVTVTAPSNLLIKTEAGTTYSSIATDESVAVELVPASTISGATGTFYGVKDGQAINADGSFVAASTQFETVSAATTNKGYVDFNFVLKTEGTEELTVYVKEFTLANAASNTKDLHPVRFAIINDTPTSTGVYNAGEGTYATTNNAIASVSDSTFLATKGAYTAATTGEAAGTTVCTIDPATSATEAITIRVWFEGEDTACTAALASNCAFNLGVTLGAKTA